MDRQIDRVTDKHEHAIHNCVLKYINVYCDHYTEFEERDSTALSNKVKATVPNEKSHAAS